MTQNSRFFSLKMRFCQRTFSGCATNGRSLPSDCAPPQIGANQTTTFNDLCSRISLRERGSQIHRTRPQLLLSSWKTRFCQHHFFNIAHIHVWWHSGFLIREGSSDSWSSVLDRRRRRNLQRTRTVNPQNTPPFASFKLKKEVLSATVFQERALCLPGGIL